MKTFTIGTDLEIDIHRHVRVDGSRFPTPDPDSIADYFIIVARWQGSTIDFYPNQGRPNDPLAIGWVGKKVLPVYENQGTVDDPVWVQVGTKRGGDFRTRMFKMFAHRLGKAVLARQLGKTIGQVTQADINATNANSRLGIALRGTFADPVDLKQFSIDDACRHLRDLDGDLETGEKPPGTVANIDADYDGNVTSAGSKTDGGTGINVRENTSSPGVDAIRLFLRFPLSSISTATAVNDVDLQVNIQSEDIESGDTTQIHAYNGTGDDDPEGDTGATAFTRCVGGSALVSYDAYTPTGSHTVDLGTTADGQVLGNVSSPAIYSLGMGATYSTGESINVEAIENAGTDPATLIVDYTVASSTTPTRMLMGVGV